MSFHSSFQREVRKCFKADIPLAERNEWEDWIKRDKAEINRLSAIIDQLEAKINKQVYDLFNLTPEEIMLLEASI